MTAIFSSPHVSAPFRDRASPRGGHTERTRSRVSGAAPTPLRPSTGAATVAAMRTRWSLSFAAVLSATSLACGSDPPVGPGATVDAGARDVAAADAPAVTDAGTFDAGTPDAPPTDAGPPVFTHVAAGSTGHACAVRSDGTLWCWGLNDKGQLAREPIDASSRCRVRGSNPERTLPCETRARRTTTFSDVADVSVGNGTTCALRRDGTVWCWGLNDAGELGQGRGNTSANATPVRVDIPAARSLALGAFHACAVLVDGGVRCWGSNKFAQCGAPTSPGPARCDEGDGTLSPCAPTPVAVPGITTARAISLGRWHSCALLADHTVRCWGLNDSAQLGTGAVESPDAPRSTPQTPAVDRVRALAAGGSHSCVLRDDGAVRCWGWGDLGQLGGAPTTNCAQSRPFQCAQGPAAVPSLSAVAALAAGRYHTCAAGDDGVVRCFGRNDNGQVGVTPSNQTTCSSFPDTFPCLRTPTEAAVSASTALSLGDYHACAVTRAGEVRCWGWNPFGQLGDGTTEDRAAAVRVLLDG
jgi:alpha-tubulin suppressor-like RCC1 family protein